MASMQTWTESIILSVLFVILLGLVVSEMNDIHSQNNSIAGLPTDSYKTAIDNYQRGVNSTMGQGQVSFTSAFGMTMSTSWDIISNTFRLLWNFVTGHWIRTIIVDYLRMPEQVAWATTSIFFLAIMYLIIKLLFRIKP